MDVDGAPAGTIGQGELDKPRGPLCSTSRFEPATLAVTLGAFPQPPDWPLHSGRLPGPTKRDRRKLIPHATDVRSALEQHEA